MSTSGYTAIAYAPHKMMTIPAPDQWKNSKIRNNSIEDPPKSQQNTAYKTSHTFTQHSTYYLPHTANLTPCTGKTCTNLYNTYTVPPPTILAHTITPTTAVKATTDNLCPHKQLSGLLFQGQPMPPVNTDGE